MSDQLDMASIRVALRRIMDRKGVKPTTLSQRIGPSKTLVKDLLEKNDDVRISTLVKLAGALDVDVGELLQRPRVPIAGFIGAGGQVIFEESLDWENAVPRPPAISGTLSALEVRGDSMLPKYEPGDIVYISVQHEGVLPQYIGRYCAVRLKSGETYLKRLAYGSEPGRFTLQSLNAADMADVELEWATPVLFVLPADSRTAFE